MVLVGASASASVVSAAMSQLGHQESHARTAAVLTLKHFACRGKDEDQRQAAISKALLEALRDTDQRVRQAACDASVELICESKSSDGGDARFLLLNTIINQSREPNADVRATAAYILKQISSPGLRISAISTTGGLQVEATDLRQRASNALQAMAEAGDRQAAKFYIPDEHNEYSLAFVSERLGSVDPVVRRSAASEIEAVQVCGCPDAVQKALELLGHDDAGVRGDAVETLARLELARAAPVIDKLVNVNARSSA